MKAPFRISALIYLAITITACQTSTTVNSESNTNTLPAAAGNGPSQNISRIVSSTSEEDGWQVTYQTNWVDLATIECVDNQTCYALSEQEFILRTTNSGESWDQLGAEGLAVRGDSLFDCATGSFCLLIESPNGGNVWATYNGGSTWEKMGDSPVNDPEGLACPASDKCIVVSRIGKVLSTQDGGETWHTSLSSSGITHKDITCPGESVCYIAGMVFAGEYGIVAKTIDGGTSWELAGESPIHGLRSIDCPTLDECLSVGRFGAQITHDGGQSWHELPGMENGGRSVACSSPDNCFIIDSDGRVFHWDGANLEKRTLEDEFSLRDTGCTPNGTCYVVGAFTESEPSSLASSAPFGNIQVSIGLVLLAGIVSFLSPCVLPVLPGYLTYLAARASGQELRKVSRWQVLFHGIAFVLGFGIVFITLGATASAVGQWLYSYKEWITRIGGVLTVFFGLQMSGILHIPFLEMQIRKQAEPNPRLGYISSLLMGVFFSAGWTPCIGPTLGLVLTLAGTEASLTKGVLLLVVYSLGLGLPFIITALAMDRVGRWMRRMAQITRYITLASGVLLAFVGFLLILGQLNFLAEFLPGLTFYL